MLGAALLRNPPQRVESGQQSVHLAILRPEFIEGAVLHVVGSLIFGLSDGLLQDGPLPPQALQLPGLAADLLLDQRAQPLEGHDFVL